MTRRKGSSEKKISAEFAARLDRLGPREKVQAIVLLRTGEIDDSSGRRQSRAERAATVEAMRRSAEQALAKVDGILERYDGQRLAESPDALASVPVEVTAAGIKALASSKWVEAVLEDQGIHLTF